MEKILLTKSGIVLILTLMIISLSLIPFVSALDLRQIYNPFTRQLDYYRGSNWTGENITVDNLKGIKKITFAFGEMIDNLVDGWIRITGGLNITGPVEIHNNVSMQGNWIKDVHVEGFTLNATFPMGVSGDCFYVGNISTTYTKYCPTYISIRVK